MLWYRNILCHYCEGFLEIPLLQDIVIICGLAIGVIFVCHRLAIPSIVGLLLTGVLAGPYGLGIISQSAQVEHLAEIGVVCLLFTIGLEFSLKSLLKIKFMSLVGGGLQVLLTVVAAAAIAHGLGLPLNKALFCGFLVSLSSTAIVLRILQERAEMESPHGRLIVGILLFQDIAVVPMMLLAPILAGGDSDVGRTLLILLAKAAAVIVLVAISAKWIIPSVLYQIARLRARELFILGIVFVGLGVAWATAEVGLSLALGAFLAGLIVSESEYSHRALGNVIPFRDLFTSFFFVSVGMLLDLRFVAGHAGLLAVAAAGAVVLKCLAAGTSATLLGLPLRTSLLTGLGLAHIGEFAFVLSESGLRLGLIDGDLYQLFLGVSVLTMIFTPFFIAGGERVSDGVLRLPWPERLRSGLRPSKEVQAGAPLRDHLVIVGFGLNGRNLSRAAKAAGIPRIIVELNPETVRKEQERGEPIFYGDASQDAVLAHAGVKQARVMVIVISDPVAARRIVDAARKLNPRLHIIARTRFVTQMEPLYGLGADEVIPEDYEASVEVLVRVLTRYLVPKNDIERFVGKFRAAHYDMLRELTYTPPNMTDFAMQIPDVEIASVRVCTDSPFAGKSLTECGLRTRHGVTVLALQKNSDVVANPSGKDRLEAGQVAILLGTPEQIGEVSNLLMGTCDVEQNS